MLRCLPRRSLLAATAATLALPLARPALAQTGGALRPVTLRLDWVFQGPNSGFMMARERGFYAEAGLDVDIGAGRGSGSTAQLIASKAAQFGFADGYVVGNSISRGMDIRQVAGIFRRNPGAVIVLDESDIRSPRDLEGKSIGITTGSAQFQQWPAFMRGHGLNASRIRVVTMDPAAPAPALLNGQVPAIAGFAQGFVPMLELRGNRRVRLFWYADAGVTAVSNGIIVHNDLIRADPDLVRRFVRATLRGFLHARQNPDEVPGVVRRYLDTADPAIVRRELELSWESWVTPNTANRPLGWSSEEDWAATVEVLRSFGGVTTPLEARQLFTNDFVPEGAEFVPPQRTAARQG